MFYKVWFKIPQLKTQSLLNPKGMNSITALTLNRQREQPPSSISGRGILDVYNEALVDFVLYYKEPPQPTRKLLIISASYLAFSMSYLKHFMNIANIFFDSL